MSESETKGRCRREIAAAFRGTGFTANKEVWLLADALDRLAADVAAVKDATLPQTTEERDCAIRERDEARAECGRLHAELSTRPEPRGWLTEEERELLALVKEMADDELGVARRTWRCNWPYSRVSLVVKAILTRAGSPPVVEVPAISRRDVPMQNEAFAYRDAMDKAGVKWKEVPRE